METGIKGVMHYIAKDLGCMSEICDCDHSAWVDEWIDWDRFDKWFSFWS